MLAPIRASRAKLQEAAAMLAGSPATSPPLYSEVLNELRAASLNCYVYEADGMLTDGLEERASLLQQQLPLSDPCTFRILHKNALTLVTDPQMVHEADESLDMLVRMFQLLDLKLDQAREGDQHAAEVVPSLLQQCIDANMHFEKVIKECIGLPA